MSHDEALKLLVIFFVGMAILLNLYYTAKQTKAFHDSAIAALESATAALKNTESVEAKRMTECFIKAVAQLASPEITIRIGGIYALERIAQDFPERNHWTIMEVLSAFVRENACLKKYLEEEEQLSKISTDIQAALTVMTRRDSQKDPENQNLNLRSTDLSGADLREAHLERANLEEANLLIADAQAANLQGASLGKANLQQANCQQAQLQGADIRSANLQSVDLGNANLQGANLNRANLQGANLKAANLQKANLFGANLQGANLDGANLQGADLYEANLQGANLQWADFKEANLIGANLSEAKNLELKQIAEAYGNDTVAHSLPETIKAPAHWIQSGD